MYVLCTYNDRIGRQSNGTTDIRGLLTDFQKIKFAPSEVVKFHIIHAMFRSISESDLNFLGIFI